MSPESLKPLPAFLVPQPDCLIIGPRSKQSSIRGPGETADIIRMSGESLEQFEAWWVFPLVFFVPASPELILLSLILLFPELILLSPLITFCLSIEKRYCKC